MQQTHEKFGTPNLPLFTTKCMPGGKHYVCQIFMILQFILMKLCCSEQRQVTDESKVSFEARHETNQNLSFAVR